MKLKTLAGAVGTTLLLLTGCGGDEPATGQAPTAASGKPSSQASLSSDDPCRILGEPLLRVHFQIPEGETIESSPSKYSPHPLCMVSWRKANADQLEQERGKAMSDYLQKKMRGEDVEMPSFRSTDEVTLTLVMPIFDNESAARASFDSVMQALANGITGKHKDVEVTFQADLEAVDGVGDKAMWAASMRQLSVVDGRRIFHVTVNTGAEPQQDLATARALAVDIAAKL